MVSTFHGLELGKRALFASQARIATTGHNIANADTEGYSRQRVNTIPSSALPVHTGGAVNPSQLGSGVSIDSITRVRDQYLDRMYRDQAGILGEWSAKQATLAQLESIVGEPSETGLRAAMDQFWQAWQDLANEPDSLPARAVVKERAQALVDTAKAMDHAMTTLKHELEEKQMAQVREANGYLQQIAELNRTIRRSGAQANDLLDRRDAVTEKLSQLTTVHVDEQTDGTLSISTLAGTSLVEGANVESWMAPGEGDSGALSGTAQSIEIVEHYQDKLHDMVKGLVFGEITVDVPAGSNLADGRSAPDDQPIQVTVNGINGLLQLGWSIREDEQGNAQPGAALFVGDAHDFTIASLDVNPVIHEDIRLIAASLRTETVNGQQKVVSGNHDLAQLIANGRDEAFMIDGDAHNVGRFFQSIVSELGTESQAATHHVANQEAALQATERRRQSVSGVSLDEEMANLIKYQHAYNAAARLVSTTDQMLDTIINRMAVR